MCFPCCVAGDPDRGFGKNQPGSWAYSLLPYLEQNALYQRGATDDDAATARTVRTPLKCFHCPSRRAPKRYPVSVTEYTNSNCQAVKQAKSDYAANYGSTKMRVSAVFGYGREVVSPTEPTGVIYDCSETRLEDISDGAACTYLLGEKFVYSDQYEMAGAGEVVISADSNGKPVLEGTPYLPQRDAPAAQAEGAPYLGFGSPHESVFGMAMCDASVHLIHFEIDPAVHAALAHRADGTTFDLPD